MNIIAARRAKPYRGIAMEGRIAAWYAKATGRNLAEFARLAERLTAALPSGASVLEVAPGPGFLAIELARRGGLEISGVDISQSFVRIASENAARAGVHVNFLHGDAAALPFGEAAFDFLVTRAAFKNFSDPLGALREFRRVLKPGGEALIIDMKKETTGQAIDTEVAKMNLGSLDALATRATLRLLRKRAYSRGEFARMAEAAGFSAYRIEEAPLGFEVRLVK